MTDMTFWEMCLHFLVGVVVGGTIGFYIGWKKAHAKHQKNT